MKLYTYYLKYRPAQPGAIPREGLQPVNPSGQFEERTKIAFPNPFFDPNSARPAPPMTELCNAHGYVQYDRPLAIEQILQYELEPAPVKKAIWCDRRVIGHAYMTQETADMLNAMPEAGVYYGSEQPWEMQGTEGE